VEGVCGFMGRSHPSHPCTAPHPTVYETSWASWIFSQMDEILVDEKSMFAR